ncbi:MAG: LamG-like jellyroll fold domain-containing protein [Planctomycetota bacterium]
MLRFGWASIGLAAMPFSGPAVAQLTTRLSVNAQGVQGDNHSGNVSISADGQVAAFESIADNLVAGDTNATSDVFVLRGGTIVRASVDSNGNQGNGYSFYPSVSADGRFVAFTSLASNLVAGDTNGTFDAFVHDLETGETTLVSVDSSGQQGLGESAYATISADGRLAAFQSAASNLVAGDTNGRIDVFVHDLFSQETTRVSVDSQGNQANGESDFAVISADGLVVGFYSYATNLVSGDTNGHIDTFVHDRFTGLTTRVSVDSQGNQLNGDSLVPSLSGDGRFVTFPGPGGVLLYDAHSGVTTPVASGDRPTISFDGAFVAFASSAPLVPEDTNGKNDVFLYDRLAATFTRVSVGSTGVQGDDASQAGMTTCVSGDGQQVAFFSYATNLVAGDTNQVSDVFLRRVTCEPPQGDGCLARPLGLVGWWPLDDTAGEWVNDLAIQNGGMRSGAVPGAGVVGGCLSFDGSFDAVLVLPRKLAPLDFGTGDFSIVAWIKTTEVKGALPVVSKRWPATLGYSLQTSDGVMSVTLGDGSTVTIRGTRSVADGCWHLVAATIDRDDAAGAKLYVDGELDVAGNVTAHPNSTSNSTQLLIGAYAASPTSFRGSIDEVQLFARNLSNAEVAAIYAAGASGTCRPPCTPPDPTFAAWWPFDEAGTQASDLAGCSNGMLTGTTRHVAGVSSGALGFDRKGWVEVPDADCLDIGTSDFSLEAWVRPTGSPFGIQSILDKRDATKGYHWFLFGGRPGLQIAFGGTFINWIAPGAVPFDYWHHVAVTVSRASASGGQLYINGKSVWTFDPRPMNVDISNSVNLLLGGHRDQAMNRFLGDIDEVTLYHSALSAAEVNAVFLAGAGGKCK